VPVFHSATHAGWISATGAAVWEEKLRSGEIEADPQIIRATRVPGDVATIIRQELVSDEEFYANDLIRELLRITDIDAHLAGWCRTGAGGEVLGMAFHREYRGPPASPRQRSVLRLFLDEFHRLWHAGKMAAANGTAGEESRPESHLSPRERQVLEGLLGGLTVKQVATNLGLSHRTVEGHVKSLHRKYNVNSRGELLARCLRKF
jgi:DNA-binding CsgD family transcriptional regulator